MATQHASLSEERWSAFTLDQQILMIANEMNRASKLMAPEYIRALRNCYERILHLTDLTLRVHDERGLRRELLRWRDLIASLYISAQPGVEEHMAAFRCLLLFTPEAAKQRSHVLRMDARQ